MRLTKTEWVLMAAGWASGLGAAGCSSGSSSAESVGRQGSALHAADGGGPLAVIASAPVDFGLTDCGTTATSTAVTVTNGGSSDLAVAAATSGAWFAVQPASARVAPGATATFTLTATVPATAAAAAVRSGKLVLTTNDRTHARTAIALSATAQGATLAFAAGSPKALNFGAAPFDGGHADAAVDLENVGNAVAAFALGDPSDGHFANANVTLAGGLAPGATGVLEATFDPRESGATGKFIATAAIHVASGAVCGDGVSAIRYSGLSSKNGLAGWPTTPDDLPGPGLDLEAPCGGSASASFTLANPGTKAVTITTVTPSSGSAFTTDLAAGTVIAPNGSRVVTVAGPAVPFPGTPGPFATGSLTVETSVPGDVAHVLALAETATGAILSFDTSETPGFGAFPATVAGTSLSQDFDVVNSGTPESLVFATTGPFTAQALNPPAGETLSSVTFSPATAGTFDGTLAVTANALCQPAPAPLPLSGTGEYGTLKVSPATMTVYGSCGSSSSSVVPSSFVLTNGSGNPVTWSASPTGAVVLGLSGSTLAPGASVTVPVTGNPIPQYPLAFHTFASINFTTDAPAPLEPIQVVVEGDGYYLLNPVHDIDLGDVPVGTSASTTVQNQTVGPDPFQSTSLRLVSESPALTVAWGMPPQRILTLSVRTLGPQSATAQWVSIPTQWPFCVPTLFHVTANGI